ncbi:hypothetical protein ACK8P5_25990 (plasmid) [Paenibacillus sp. EC2-1]|uniref:hypothetical protein n=1 Tax=Paenibacillus sp. EC2-1 TaxID=3388665 RepID=UPI003BEEF12D
MTKVVSFNEAKNKKDQETKSDQAVNAIADYLDSKMAEENVKVEEIVFKLDNALSDHADVQENKPDINNAIEGLARTSLFLAMDMDREIDVLEPHNIVRMKMIESIAAVIDHITESSPHPVYAHDIYIALQNVTIGMAQNFQRLTLMREYKEDDSSGKSNNESDSGR